MSTICVVKVIVGIVNIVLFVSHVDSAFLFLLSIFFS